MKSYRRPKLQTATHPRAVTIVSGSPWLREGSFFNKITAGDKDHVIVCGPAPSWEANPDAITEAGSHRKEDDPRKWAREYLCTFQSAISGGFFPAHINCIDAARPGDGPDAFRIQQGLKYYVSLDPALHQDRSAVAVGHVEARGPRTIVVVDTAYTIPRPRGQSLSPELVVDRVSALRKNLGSPYIVYGDQWSADFLKYMFARKGIVYQTEDWTGANKLPRYSMFRQGLVDNLISLPSNPQLANELLATGTRLTSAGNELIEPGGRDDLAQAVIQLYCQIYNEVGGQIGSVLASDQFVARTVAIWNPEWPQLDTSVPGVCR